MKNLFKPFSNLSTAQQLIVSIVSCSFLLPIQFFTQIHLNFENKGIDHSEMMTLSYAFIRGWKYGEDIIFTYGPLSFLANRTDFSQNRLVFLLFDLYFFSSICFAFFQFLKTKDGLTTLLVFFLTCFFYKNAMFLTLVFTLQVVALLYLILYHSTNNILYVVQASIITWLIFFIKLNLAFVAVFILLVFVLYYVITKALSLSQGAILIILNVLTGLLLFQLLPVDIQGYIQSAIYIVNDYSEGATVPPTSDLMWLLIVILFCVVLFVGYLILSSIKATAFQRLINFNFALLTFICFKQCVVRADLEHLKDFPFIFPWMVCGYWYVFNSFFNKTSYSKLLLIPLITSWLFASYILILFGDHQYILKKFITVPAYFINMYQGYDYYQEASKRKLPPKILNQVKHKSVDIIPWETSTLILNKLNYNPRPVFKTYQAYSPYLDAINAHKLMGNTKPTFIIYAENTIDKRYSFFDETQTKLAMLLGYEVVDSFSYNQEQNILLKAKVNGKIKKSIIEKAELKKATILIPTSSNYLLLKANFNYSFLGSLVRIFYQAPLLEAKITTAQGHSYVYTVNIATLKKGVFVNKHISNTPAAQRYFEGNLERDCDNIVKIEFLEQMPSFWQKQIYYELQELKIIP